MSPMIVLPSTDDRREYTMGNPVIVMGPEGMPLAEALAVVNEVVYRANKEDNEAVERGDSGCEDGLVVEESIRRRLTALGFTLPEFIMGACWDQYQPDAPDAAFSERFDEVYLPKAPPKP